MAQSVAGLEEVLDFKTSLVPVFSTDPRFSKPVKVEESPFSDSCLVYLVELAELDQPLIYRRCMLKWSGASLGLEETDSFDI